MIVGSTTLYTSLPASGWLPVTYNASAYSHSTVFVIYATTDSSFTNLNAPPLTTHFTPLGECADRWMLAGGQVVTFTREVFASETPITSIAITSQTQNAAIWTLSQTRPATPSLTSLAAASTSSLAIGDATAPVITSSAALLPRSDYIFQNSTVFSVNFNGTATDPSYRMCQPFRLAPTYSPGICPSGQTVAEVTAFQVVASTGYRTFWQASCCRRFVAHCSKLNRTNAEDQRYDLWSGILRSVCQHILDTASGPCAHLHRPIRRGYNLRIV